MVAHADPYTESTSPIKLLDLLTNRYHTGIVRGTSPSSLDVELPPSSRLAPGQRVRFIVGDQPLVARNSMRRGFVTASPRPRAIRLAVEPEATAV